MLLKNCVFAKVVSVPMRVGEAAISVVPIARNTAHRGGREIDNAADKIDNIPL
jgi:hypothetical protein